MTTLSLIFPPSVKPNVTRASQYGGTKSISGTVKVGSVPGPYLVVLHESFSSLKIDQTLSAPDGTYAFKNLTSNYKYMIIAYDHTHTYNAVIADQVTPV